jgi:hypothetical protein
MLFDLLESAVDLFSGTNDRHIANSGSSSHDQPAAPSPSAIWENDPVAAKNAMTGGSAQQAANAATDPGGGMWDWIHDKNNFDPAVTAKNDESAAKRAVNTATDPGGGLWDWIHDKNNFDPAVTAKNDESAAKRAVNTATDPGGGSSEWIHDKNNVDPAATAKNEPTSPLWDPFAAFAD